MPDASPRPTSRPARTPREAKPRGVLCPFCGEVSPDLKRCRGCRAFLDPLSRQASQNEMGPWAVRDPLHPFRPGCSYDTIRKLAASGRIGPTTVIRGPTTRQSWLFAGRTPGVANLLGLCHNCQREVNPDTAACPACGASFVHEADRQHLGLAPVHLLPGQASPESIASATSPTPTPPATARPVAPPPPSAAPAPDPSAIIAAAHRRLVRMRASIAVLALLVVALGAAFAGSLAGWRPFTLGEPAPGAPVDRPSVAAEAPPAGERPAEASQPEPDPKPAAPQPEPDEPPPAGEADAPAPADPAEPPSEPPSGGAAPVEERRAFRDRALALLAADGMDTARALEACDAWAAADPRFDPGPWRRIIASRGAWDALRRLP